jgi:hypothetical protein
MGISWVNLFFEFILKTIIDANIVVENNVDPLNT